MNKTGEKKKEKRSVKLRVFSFEKIKKIDKHLARLTKKKEIKNQK